MYRFLCFSSSGHPSKSKRNSQQPSRGTQVVPKSSSESKSMKYTSACTSFSPTMDEIDVLSAPLQNASSSHDDCCRSEELNACSCPDEIEPSPQLMSIKKSFSLGNILEPDRDHNCADIIEQSLLALHASAERNIHADGELRNSYKSSAGSASHFGGKKSSSIEDALSDCFVPLDGHHNADLRADGSNEPGASTITSNLGPRHRSYDDLCYLEGSKTDDLNHEEVLCSATQYSGEDAIDEVDGARSTTSITYDENEDELLNGVYWKAKSVLGDQSIDAVSACNADSGDECAHSDSLYVLKEMAYQDKFYEPSTEGTTHPHQFKEPEIVEVLNVEVIPSDSSPEDVYLKRIEEWIDQIEIGNGVVVEELGDSSSKLDYDSEPVAAVPPGNQNPNSIEIAYKYISSLNPQSSQAQLANRGLVAIPVLCGFASLRVLNLSANHIDKINSGALPKGLHALNLSRNNISTIEGLRDLTRLRVLDISYNRLARIGHGLASCSSLKELYLAGNKISHVDGLHRLLKLKILDLRKNKISTAKGLGQLAANYSCLEMIYLDGNPAQKNVGDDQLKKYLLNLLPNLVYYNKHAVRAKRSLEVSDRHARSVLSHGSNHGGRSERKPSSRRLASGTSGHKLQPSHQSRTSRPASTFSRSSRANNEPFPPALRPAGAANAGTQPLIRRIKSEGKLC